MHYFTRDDATIIKSGSIIYMDKMSKGSESDDCVTANGRVYIPKVRNEETPAVGMKFDSL
ncbi:hypothetical protein Prudu_016980 [Prunus dulcis]|uniref:Uncharacterized protein n=1 Tax=Prunus dulcis TaxID=3755 RepID=A0A4Y1RPA9_PRUDU|nr:hypothetical protein Prudu_016980 [Prunus dulcis]